MLKIDSISVQKFRGIVDLTLDLGGQNFAICGPNGTGKSGVVDAIEFGLSGDISRLSGKGRGAVSVKNHAPHVDYRNDPEVAEVTITGTIHASGAKFSITRSVDNPKFPTIEPENPEILTVINELGRHKNVTLSRRELIQYVLSTPGDRASEIQALLQLGALRDIRQRLQKISKECERDAKAARQARTVSEQALTTALAITKLGHDAMLAAINERRRTLNLPDIDKIEASTSVKDGLSVVSAESAAKIPKVVAVAEIKKLEESIENCQFSDDGGPIRKCQARCIKLLEDTTLDENLKRQQLLVRAHELANDGYCPVCDTEWGPDELGALINEKLNTLRDGATEKDKLQQELEPVIQLISTCAAAAKSVEAFPEKLGLPISTATISAFGKTLEIVTKTCRDFPSLSEINTALSSVKEPSQNFNLELTALSECISALPDTSDRDAARDYLVAVDERLDAYRRARQSEVRKNEEATRASAIFECYEKTYKKGLEKIYSDIQNDFANLYSRVNSDDEGDFEALLAAEKSGLGLDVDFYGRGKFPPGAYHSEGHQDGMGLCLYLALMKHLYEDDFQFCVLDDVLMSVDSAHRRSICRVISESFPNTQFIFTTHDEVWLRNMQSAGLITSKRQVQFRNWSVETGPLEWVSNDVWNEIDQHLEANDVRAAAASLRYYLEYLASHLCHNFSAPVVYRGDNRHALGDLYSAWTSRYKKLLSDARKAANSWSNKQEIDRITQLESQYASALEAVSSDIWTINAKIHYNEWANLDKNDFEPIVKAFRNIITFVQCDSCSGLLYVVPDFGKKENLRCPCGTTTFNFVGKS